MARCGKTRHRRPKTQRYGQTHGFYWCWGCDAELVSPNGKHLKKRARQKAKKEIKEESED